MAALATAVAAGVAALGVPVDGGRQITVENSLLPSQNPVAR